MQIGYTWDYVLGHAKCIKMVFNLIDDISIQIHLDECIDRESKPDHAHGRRAFYH